MSFERHREGFTVSTDPGRLDVHAIHSFLVTSYWAEGIPREILERALRNSLCFGLYEGEKQIGLARVITDAATYAYLCDVYVLPELRGRGLGEELVREMVDNGPYADVKWLLHTTDMHPLYRKLGFEAPSYKVLERRSTRNASESG